MPRPMHPNANLTSRLYSWKPRPTTPAKPRQCPRGHGQASSQELCLAPCPGGPTCREWAFGMARAMPIRTSTKKPLRGRNLDRATAPSNNARAKNHRDPKITRTARPPGPPREVLGIFVGKNPYTPRKYRRAAFRARPLRWLADCSAAGRLSAP